jgi:aspartyl-tRNA synthetase
LTRGLGFERTLAYVTGLANVRDAIPFPRTPRQRAVLKSTASAPAFAGTAKGEHRRFHAPFSP